MNFLNSAKEGIQKKMSLRRAKFENRKFLIVQVEFCKIIGVARRKICFLGVSMGNVGLRRKR